MSTVNVMNITKEIKILMQLRRTAANEVYYLQTISYFTFLKISAVCFQNDTGLATGGN